MSIPRCYTYDDGSIFVSEHQSNTLLDVCNQVLILLTAKAATSIDSALEHDAISDCND